MDLEEQHTPRNTTYLVPFWVQVVVYHFGFLLATCKQELWGLYCCYLSIQWLLPCSNKTQKGSLLPNLSTLGRLVAFCTVTWSVMIRLLRSAKCSDESPGGSCYYVNHPSHLNCTFNLLFLKAPVDSFL